MSAKCPLFEVNSVYNRLRERISGNRGLPGLFYWLHDRLSKQAKDAALLPAAARVHPPSTGWFKLTEQVFDVLKSENVPESVLAKLNELKNEEFSRDDFEKKISILLNSCETNQFQRLILDHAQFTTLNYAFACTDSTCLEQRREVHPELWVAAPVGDASTRRLTISFKLDPALLGGRRIPCRVLLLDADALARIWHSVWSGRGWQDRAPFDAGTPYYDRVNKRLVERKGRDSRLLSFGVTDHCVTSLQPMKGGQFVAVEESGVVRLWRNDLGKMVQTPHDGIPIRCLTVLPDGQRIASADYSGRLLVWEPDRPAAPVTELPQTGKVGAIVAVDSNRVAIGLLSGQLAVYQIDNRSLEAECRAHDGRVLRMAVRPVGDIVSWGADCRLMHWRLGQDAVPGPEIPEPLSLAVKANGEVLTGSSDGRMTRWDPDSDKSPRTDFLPQEYGTVHGIMPLPGDRSVILANGTPCYTDLIKRQSIKVADSTAIAVHPDGEFLSAFRCERGAGLLASSLDRSEQVDVVLRACLQNDVLSRFEVSRLLATLPELKGEVDEQGCCLLEGKVPNRMADGTMNLVELENLLDHLVVVAALDLSGGRHERTLEANRVR
jgi:hypothetical protein